MIVVDIETTGTNPIKHSIVSVGAVDMNNLNDNFYEECRIWEGARVDDEALVINGMSEEEILDPKKQTEGEMVSKFLKWFSQREDKVLAGHNPSFDISFLGQASDRWNLDFRLSHRSIDQHTVCYMHMILKGKTPPLKKGKTAINSDFIMKYVGIPTEPKPHNALNGALWETEALSRLLYNKNLLEQFSEHKIPWVNED